MVTPTWLPQFNNFNDLEKKWVHNDSVGLFRTLFTRPHFLSPEIPFIDPPDPVLPDQGDRKIVKPNDEAKSHNCTSQSSGQNLYFSLYRYRRYKPELIMDAQHSVVSLVFFIKFANDITKFIRSKVGNGFLVATNWKLMTNKFI